MDISVLQEQPLPEFFLLADPQAQRNDRSAHRNDRRVSISPMQLRHPRKVHPVPAGTQRQRQKNRRYDRQNLHNAILPDINFRLKKRLDLRTVFTQKLGFLPQPDHALFKKMEKSALLLGEEVIFIFPQFTGYVVKLGIVAIPRHCFFAQTVPNGDFSSCGAL